MGNIIMSQKERKQVEIFEKYKRKEITRTLAAQMLGVSPRWVTKKSKRYAAEKIAGLAHKNRGKPSKRRLGIEVVEKVVKLFGEGGDLSGFPPTHGAEVLQDRHQIVLSKETLRQVLTKHGLWKPLKKGIVHRQRRERRAFLGVMTQLDGSPHDWFEGRGPRCTLLVFIDDATSKLLWLEFAPSESVHSLMTATLNYFSKCGRPTSFYVDHAGTFKVNTHNPNGDKITQFERAMKELDVKMIHAGSPQAKGRVERVNDTLQKRLVLDMRLEGISSMDAANAFVRNGYLERHNQKFAVQAREPGDVHRSMKNIDSATIFCIKHQRTVQRDFTVVYNNRCFQLLKQQKTVLKPTELIDVYEHLDGTISLRVGRTLLASKEIKARPAKVVKSAVDFVNQELALEALPQTSSTSAGLSAQ